MKAVDAYIRQTTAASGEGPVANFTIDRENALALMRRFALADPHFYILELVQAAVANGTTFIDVDMFRYSLDVDFRLRWTGKLFSRLSLLNLFDYLFEADDNYDDADIILLARGINALLHFEPDRLTIFSAHEEGDEPTQIEIDPKLGRISLVAVDKELEKLRGVCIRAHGLKKMPPNLRIAADGNPAWPEQLALSDRVGLVPLEIEFNQDRIVSTHLERKNFLDGRGKPLPVVDVDEPDLQARLWKNPETEPVFRIMTFGVGIERLSREELPLGSLSGLVNFNRLTKTADHYGIVRDAKLAHCIARLRPYAALVGKDEGEAPRHEIKDAEGNYLSPEALAEILRSTRRILVVPPENKAHLPHAIDLAKDLEATVLIISHGELDTLRALAGAAVEILAMDWDDPRDLAFLSRPHALPPSRPWLIEDIELDPIEIADLNAALIAGQAITTDDLRVLEAGMGTFGEVRARIYSPSRGELEARELQQRWIQIVSFGRIVWSGTTPSRAAFHGGHQLVINLPPVAPSVLLPLAHPIADIIVSRATQKLALATNLVLRRVVRMELTPGSIGARQVLRALAKDVVLRLRPTRDSRPGSPPSIGLTLVSQSAELLTIPLFKTVSDTPISGADLETLLTRNGGLLFGVRTGNKPRLESFDPDSILSLDEEQEALLVEMVGADAYLLIDGQGPLFDAAKITTEALLEYMNETHSDWTTQEARRQARRILQGRVIEAALRGEPIEDDPLGHLAIFEGTDRAFSFRDLRAALSDARPIVMLDGRSPHLVPPLNEISWTQGPSSDEDPSAPLLELAMSPFLAHILSPLTPIEAAFDFTLAGTENDVEGASSGAAHLVQTSFESGPFKGTLSLVDRPVRRAGVAVLDQTTGQVRRINFHGGPHLVGFLKSTQPHTGVGQRALIHAVEESEATLIARLLNKLTRFEDEQLRLFATQCLLEFAGRHLRLYFSTRGRIRFEITNKLAGSILNLAVFPLEEGNSVSAHRLIRDFCLTTNHSALHPDTPQVLRAWLAEHLNRARVQKSTLNPPAPDLASIVIAPDVHPTLARLNAWMRHLWPWPLDHYESGAQGPFQLPRFTIVATEEAPSIGYTFSRQEWRPCLPLDHPELSTIGASPQLDETTALILFEAYSAAVGSLLVPLEVEIRFQDNLARAMLP